MVKAVFNWSGGKDSALALQKAIKSEKYNIVALLTTVNKESERSTMHGIPMELLQQQAQSIGIPLHVVELAPKGGMIDYNEAMTKAVEHFKSMDVTHFIFGDIFLHDVKAYREKQLEPLGITVVEPLWGKSSPEIMEEYLQSGLKTVVVTTTASSLGKEWIGRIIDRQFVDELPEECDPCGENGEYHTFCFDGDIFRMPVKHSLGTTFNKKYPVKLDDGTIKEFEYWFADLNIAHEE